jgi:hypothetical protein
VRRELFLASTSLNAGRVHFGAPIRVEGVEPWSDLPRRGRITGRGTLKPDQLAKVRAWFEAVAS